MLPIVGNQEAAECVRMCHPKQNKTVSAIV